MKVYSDEEQRFIMEFSKPCTNPRFVFWRPADTHEIVISAVPHPDKPGHYACMLRLDPGLWSVVFKYDEMTTIHPVPTYFRVHPAAQRPRPAGVV